MRYLIGLLALSLLCWGVSLPADAFNQDFFFWRGQGIQLTGLLAIVLMSALLLMASRPRWLEQQLGGLDKLYQLHKWSGISSGVLVLMHWVLTKSPRWLIQLGWLEPGAPRAHVADAWRGLAREAGELAFYGLILLLIVSLIRALPYGRFRLIHKAGAVLALLACFHSLYLLAPALRWTSFGILAQLCCLLAAGAALWSLSGRIGRAQRVEGTVLAIQTPAPQVIELQIRLPAAFCQRYRAGQFALLTLHPDEGAHPFTLVHLEAKTGIATFAIKALGDYTRALATRLHIGDRAQVEGPFGGFTLPAASSQTQYWIAGGIGITPFVAWLEALAERGEQRPGTRLIYCVERHADVLFSERLSQLTTACGIELTMMERDRDGLLDARQLFTAQSGSCWFCGPIAMRNMLQQYLLPHQQLHYERFEFR
jgi:predicted ferric reductase